jgi:hypothetical protein
MPRWLSRTKHREFSGYWRRIARDRDAVDRLVALAGPRNREANEWFWASEGTLREAERGLDHVPEPFALLHFDTRSDNVRLENSLLRIVDWPSASVGPAELDAVAFAQSIEAEGGPACEDVMSWYEAVLPVRREMLVASAVGVAGYFADRAPRPAVPGLPRLRSIQRRQLKASLRWAADLAGLPAPSWLRSVEP